MSGTASRRPSASAGVGRLKSSEIVYNRHSQRSKGFAFVEFVDIADAKRAVEVLHSAVPNSTLVSMPGQQHIAMDTNPDLFVTEVLRFLSE